MAPLPLECMPFQCVVAAVGGSSRRQPVAAIVKPAAGLRDKWDAAEAARTSAEAAIAHHRTTVKEPLLAAINAERRILLASLVQIAAKDKLGKKWPATFFRRAGKGKKAGLVAPET